MNKKIISSVVALLMSLTVSTSNIYAISTYAENATNSVIEISDDNLTEEEIIVKNYLEIINAYTETYPNDFEKLTVQPTLMQSYLKNSGSYYDSETWNSLTEMEKGLYWTLYAKPKMMFKDRYELMQPDDIITSDNVLSQGYNMGGSAKEFMELTTDELWKYQLEQTKATGAVPDYFTVYMDLKNKASSESVSEVDELEEPMNVTTTTAKKDEPESKEDSSAAETDDVSLIEEESVEATTAADKTEPEAVKDQTDSEVDDSSVSNVLIILIVFAVIAVAGIAAFVLIRKKKK